MKTHPYLTPLIGSIHISAMLMLGTASHAFAACGNSSTTITAIPHLGGSSYTITAMNAQGQVTGYSSIGDDSEEHAFLFGSSGLFDLGTLGGRGSYANALNDFGQVVGEAFLPDDFQPPHAFFYDGTSMIDLGTLGGSFSTAVAINNAGQVTGKILTAGSTEEAFLYHNGSMDFIGHLGGFYSRAADINESGVIVGNSLTTAFDQHAFLYSEGTMLDLGDLGSGYSDAFAVNEQNVVVGESYTASGELHGFVYADGVMNDIGTLGGNYSTAYALNNAGQVIGVSTTSDGAYQGFIYRGGVMNPLGTLGGWSSYPYGINNLGQIVGEAENADGALRAFLWQDGVMTDLNSLLPEDSGWILESARFINDAERIVGLGTFNGQELWFILDLAAGENNPPVAVASVDQSSGCSGIVTLDGSASGDPDGDPLTYAWTINGVLLGTNATLTTTVTSNSTITLTVTDVCGAFAQTTVSVSAGDNIPPTINCPGNVVPVGANNCEARIPDLRKQITVSDNCTPADKLIIQQSPAPGTWLGAGQHEIVVTVTDAAGNSTTCSSTITIGDSQPPVFVCLPKPVTVSTGRDCSAVVPNLTRHIVGRDNCTPAKQLVITQSPAAGTVIEKGEHVVLLTITDKAGNSTTKSVKLRVKDLQAPKIHSVTATPNVLTANGKTVSVKVSVNATDNCDSNPKSRIVKVLCDENTSRGDIKITGPLTVELAATASSKGNGRIYTLVVVCEDASGNKSQKLVNVHVPKSKNDKPKNAPPKHDKPKGDKNDKPKNDKHDKHDKSKNDSSKNDRPRK